MGNKPVVVTIRGFPTQEECDKDSRENAIVLDQTSDPRELNDIVYHRILDGHVLGFYVDDERLHNILHAMNKVGARIVWTYEGMIAECYDTQDELIVKL